MHNLKKAVSIQIFFGFLNASERIIKNIRKKRIK